MKGLRQQDHALICEVSHETVQIEPWGRDSLRVRATMGPEIRDDLPGALLERIPLYLCGEARLPFTTKGAV
jgi:hypothetical protein